MSTDTDVKTSGSQESLSHLDRVGLEIERLPNPLTEEGVTGQELFQLLKERLSDAPVQVVSRIGALHLRGAPTLFLNVSLHERDAESYVYVITLELVQGVSVERLSDSGFVAAPTWRAQTVGITRKGQLPLLKDTIGATADAFATDLADNAK